MMEVIAYCFLIPIIPEIVELSQKNKDMKDSAIFIAERLIASGVVLLSREVLVTLIKKIIKKFR